MKRAVCMALAALILLGGVWTANPGAEASGTERAALLDDGDSGAGGSAENGGGGTGDVSDIGDSAGGGGSVASGDSVTSGDSVGSGDNLEPVQLDAPARLGWGRDYRFLLERYRAEESNKKSADASESDSKIRTDEYGAEYVECPGMMSWSTEGANQKRFQIDLYFQDPEAGPTLVETVKEWKTTGTGTMDSNFRFFWNPRSSGEYYFTVRALGDGVRYLDSEISQSGAWAYEAPEAQLTRPSRPRWKNVAEASTAFIYPPADETDVDSQYRIGYEARWWYAAALTKAEEEEVVQDGDDASAVVQTEEDNGETEADPTKPVEAGTVLTFYPQHYEFKPSEKMIGEFGSGYYSVQVRAMSGDVNKARPSDWSELSMVRHVAGADEDLQTIVDRIDSSSDDVNRQLAINNVRKFGTFKLMELMSADADNAGAVAAIEQLENVTGNYAQIVVSGGLDELFPEQAVSVIGAGLNVDLGESVVFHLGAAHADEVPSTLYSNAVRFSMQLLDGNGASLTAGDTELKVPVKITLPVPEEINPSFFTILHHRMDGTVETIPGVSLRKTDGQWRASFLVTNFSDFTMAEAAALMEAKAVRGGASVSYRFRTAGVETAFCAAFDAAGQMRGAAPLELSETRKTVTIPCDGEPRRVKLFLLDAHSAPVAASLEVPVE